jgi:hypothetical protein
MLGCHMATNVVHHLLGQCVLVIVVVQVVVVHGWMVCGFGSNGQLDWRWWATCFVVNSGGRRTNDKAGRASYFLTL